MLITSWSLCDGNASDFTQKLPLIQRIGQVKDQEKVEQQTHYYIIKIILTISFAASEAIAVFVVYTAPASHPCSLTQLAVIVSDVAREQSVNIIKNGVL